MKRIPSSRLLLLVASFMTASTGFAQDASTTGDDLSLSDLLDIKLNTGSFLELDLAKSPLSMTIIEKNKVDLSGARDLSELLEIYVPGFQVMYNRWNGKIWGMRGVVNDRNTKFIVLVNGSKMNTEARDGFIQEVALGLLGDIDRVEVLRGPAGLVYGSGAIAGIVNIVTRRAGGESLAEVRGHAGTWSNFGNTSTSFQGTVGGKISDNASMIASIGWEKSTGVGNGVSRVYGRPTWPYPGWVSPSLSPSSVPTDGSAQEIPGNWKASFDYDIMGLKVYTRFTHQVQEGGGLVLMDPWPQYQGNPGNSPDSLGAVLIDGKRVSRTDPFWSQVEASGENRREYVADNLSIDATYDLPIGGNAVKFHASLNGNSNILQHQMRPGYENFAPSERNSVLEETFGERRYTLGATYLMKNVPNLQLALGGEQRWDDIGDDLFGRNAKFEIPAHKVVEDILYSNSAIFTEGWYDVMPNLGVDFGVRWDGHTRTIDDGGTINGKFATVYTVAPGHVVKAIFQTSSNNASADNYEFNRNNYDDNGYAYEYGFHFYERTTTVPTQAAEIVPGVTLAQLHDLRPEKVYSFELTSNDDFGNGLSVSPSVSYNMVRDLFAWSQPLYRVINAGKYDNLNVDLQADWTSQYLDVGFNHAVQLVVNTDVASLNVTQTGPGFEKTRDSAGVTVARTDWYKLESDGTYTPVPNATTSVVINPVAAQITTDGENFMSLATHVSKLYADAKLMKGLTFHTDVRVFWGLWGQDSAMEDDAKLGFENLDLNTDPITKWNASLHAELPGDWSVGVYAYDILGIDSPKFRGNTIRWEQTYDVYARDLFSVDLRSYAIDFKKSF